MIFCMLISFILLCMDGCMDKIFFTEYIFLDSLYIIIKLMMRAHYHIVVTKLRFHSLQAYLRLLSHAKLLIDSFTRPRLYLLRRTGRRLSINPIPIKPNTIHFYLSHLTLRKLRFMHYLHDPLFLFILLLPFLVYSAQLIFIRRKPLILVTVY